MDVRFISATKPNSFQSFNNKASWDSLHLSLKYYHRSDNKRRYFWEKKQHIGFKKKQNNQTECFSNWKPLLALASMMVSHLPKIISIGHWKLTDPRQRLWSTWTIPPRTLQGQQPTNVPSPNISHVAWLNPVKLILLFYHLHTKKKLITRAIRFDSSMCSSWRLWEMNSMMHRGRCFELRTTSRSSSSSNVLRSPLTSEPWMTWHCSGNHVC